MTTFASWFQRYRAEDPRQITFLCGSEPVLVQYVLDSIKHRLGLAPSNLLEFRAGEGNELDFWAAMSQHPLDPRSHKLVVVRDAELLKHWGMLEDWIRWRRMMPDNHLLFVSNEDKAPTIETDEGKQPAQHIAAIKRAGQRVIECGPFTERTVPVALDWVQTLCPMKPNVAGRLLNRANGNLRLARDACLKLSALGAEPTITAVNALVREEPREAFTEALVKMDKRTALESLKRAHRAEYHRMVAQLDSQLRLVSELNQLQGRQASYADMVRALRNRGFLVKEFLPVARYYDDKKVARRRNMLSLADQALKQGASVGVLEAVVLNW